MKRLVLIGTLLFVAACGSSPNNPSPGATAPTFTATLLPASENPADEQCGNSGTGTVTVIFNVTRDANQTITAATANFQVSLVGFPANTPVNAAHIHEGASTVNGPRAHQSGLGGRRDRAGEWVDDVHQEQHRKL